MRIPRFIHPGDTIGFAAPSFGVASDPYKTRFEEAVRRFEARGYHVITVPSVYMDDGLGISTDPAKAAEDLMELYLDPGIAAVISVGGGELMNETISCVDFQRLAAAEPKWFMGYSDNTNMLIPLTTICEVPGIYGPCAPTFGRTWDETCDDAMGILEGTNLTVRGRDLFELPWQEGEEEAEEADPLAGYNLTEKKILDCRIMKNGVLTKADAGDRVTMRGTIIGGCLDILVNLTGTPYENVRNYIRKYGSMIWVLEACDLSVMAIRRALWHLKMNGWFDTAAGFVVGRPLCAFRQEMMGVDQYNAVTGVLGEFGVPIVMDADVGHVAPMIPVISGCPAEVEVQGNSIEIRHTLGRQ